MTTEREIAVEEVRECYAMSDEGLDFKRVAYERRVEFDDWLAAYTDAAVKAALEAAAVRVEAQRIVCPIHKMPDCSPLLNGCSLVNRLHDQKDTDARMVRGATS